MVTLTVFQLIFMAVMARLLEPADFGLVAIANVSLRFFSYFSQMGITPGLIQKQILEDGDISAALAISLCVSSIFFLIAIATAGLIESFFEIQNISIVVRILAINFIIVGFSSVSLGIIRRNREFRALATIEVISYLLGYGLVGLTTAYSGAGVWALVAAFMTQSSMIAIFAYAKTKHTLAIKHTSAQRKHFLNYGGRYSVNGFIEFLTSNIDAIAIGKILGETSAGFYNRALLLANIPVQQPANILTKALFPIMSRFSSENEKQSISFQLSVLLVGSYSFAVGMGIYISAPNIVSVMLGDKWLNATPILEILALSVGPIYVSHVASVALDSMNELNKKFRIQLSALFVMIASITLAIPTSSATNIALAILATEWVRLTMMIYTMIFLLKIPLNEIVKIVNCIVILTGTSVIAIKLISSISPPALAGILQLLVEIFSGVLGLLFGMLLIRKYVSNHPAVIFLGERVPIIAKILA